MSLKISSLKVGDELYQASIDDRRVAFRKYIVRTIQNRGGELTAYLIKYVPGLTWGKRSKKRDDVGWLDPIDPMFREKITDRKDSDRFSKTKVASVRKCLATTRRLAANKRGRLPQDYADSRKMEIPILERWIKRHARR